MPAVVLLFVSLVAFKGVPHLLAHDGDDHGGVIEGGEGCSPIPFPYLPPFMDALPIPEVATPARFLTNYCVPIATNLCVNGVIPVYEMPEVDVWGYDGHYPGPTIEAEVNKPVVVHWTNALPVAYPDWLLANTTLHGVHDQSVQTVVHLHGAAVLPRYDGYPTNYFGSGSSDEYFYSNIDFNGDGETLWYHDHALGRTANIVYAGLSE
jgi:spore coat protein A